MKTTTKTTNEIKSKVIDVIDTYFLSVDMGDDVSSIELKMELMQLLKEYEKKSK